MNKYFQILTLIAPFGIGYDFAHGLMLIAGFFALITLTLSVWHDFYRGYDIILK